MKRKVKMKDGNKVVEQEVVIPSKDHLAAQIKYPTRVYKDKTKYTRKQKHRNRNDYWYALFV